MVREQSRNKETHIDCQLETGNFFVPSIHPALLPTLYNRLTSSFVPTIIPTTTRGCCHLNTNMMLFLGRECLLDSVSSLSCSGLTVSHEGTSY